MNLQVHIERLVLDGLAVAPGDGQAVQAALEAELAELLAGGRLAPELLAGAAVAGVQAPPVELPAGDPAGLGRRVARSLYGGLGDPSGNGGGGR